MTKRIKVPRSKIELEVTENVIYILSVGKRERLLGMITRSELNQTLIETKGEKWT